MEEGSSEYTLDEALSRLGFGTFQVYALLFSGIGYFSDAMEMSLLSFIGPALKSEWSLTPIQESLITTVVFVGMLCGAVFWGLIADSFGRKTGIQIVSLIVFGAGLLSSFSPNYVSLLIFRLILGFGASGGHVFVSWFLEFVPRSNRGAWMLGMSTSWILGEVLETLLAWLIMPRFGWRLLLIVSSLPSFTVLILSGFAPESPRYLFMKGRRHEATTALEKVAQINRKQLPAGTLVSDDPKQLEVAESSVSEETDLLSLRGRNFGLRKWLQDAHQLVSSDLLRTTLLLWALDFSYTFIYYGIQLMISSLSSGQGDCASSSSKSDDDVDALYVTTLVTCLAELPGLVLAALLVDRFGRKICMETVSLLTVVAILPLLWPQTGTATSLLLITARMFNSAAFSTLVVYSEEVYPTCVRGTGAGVMSGVGRFGGILCPIVAVGLVRGCHLTAAVGLFGSLIVLSGACVMLFPFETKGKDLFDT
ncbi:hypothetical protein M569_10450, partial [Genlisea aurea]